MTSQRAYMHDMTPMKRTCRCAVSPQAGPGSSNALTRYLSATPPPTNQNKTISPVIPMINVQVLDARMRKRILRVTHAKDVRVGLQQALPGPPQREQEKGSEGQAGDLARVGVEPTRDEGCANEGGAEVACGQGEPADSA
jgi:hypothetical protein